MVQKQTGTHPVRGVARYLQFELSVRPRRHGATPDAIALLIVLALLGLGGCTTLSESQGSPGETSAYGVWTGRLPCADCPGVDTRLVLWRNPELFRLTETFLDAEGGPKTFTSYGYWELEQVGKTPQLGRLKLITNDAQRTLYLERQPTGSLRLLGRDGEPFDSELDYVLERTRSVPEPSPAR